VAALWTIWEQKFHSGAMGPEWAQTWPERIVIAGKAVCFYLGKLFWPHPLIFIYPRWPVAVPGILAYLPVLAVAISLFGLWLNRRRMWPAFFAFAYFVVLLFPVLDFFNVYFFRYSFVGDHFQYLAGIGPLALAAAGIAAAAGFFRKRMPFLEPMMCAMLVLVLGTLTWKQCGMYANVETLWQTTLRQNPKCWLAHGDLGKAFLQKGKVDEAIAHFQKSLELNPNYAATYYDLGLCFFKLGRIDEAIAQYEKALQISPGYPVARNDLGLALCRQGRVDDAIVQYEKALQINPGNAEFHVNLGDALREKGRVDEAIAHYQKALQISPDHAGAHNDLGNALLQKGRADEAITQYQMALKIIPDDASVHFNLGNALLHKSRAEEALVQLQEALKLAPADPTVQGSLAWLLATCPKASLRNGSKAVELARQANELAGGKNPVFLHTLAAAFAEAGRFSEAVETARRALRLAGAQPNPGLAGALQSEIKLYQAGNPFHLPQQTP
jgi:tetratricopeptide (TPR) repeat protein